MQTSLHIFALARELNEHIVGSIFKASEYFKKQREAYLLFKTSKGTEALGLVYHPHGYGTFLLPRGKVNIDTNEKPWPFFQEASGAEVISVEQISFDRILKIVLKKENRQFTIVVEAIGPNGNFWLLDENGKIIATLRNKKYDADVPYKPPPPIDKLNLLNIEQRHLIEIFGRTEQSVENILRKSIAGLDKNLIDEILHRSDIDNEKERVDSVDIDRILKSIKEIITLFDDYHRGYWYRLPGGNCAYPFKLKVLDDQFNKARSLSYAIYEALREKKSERSEIDQKQVVLEAISRYIKKSRRKIGKIEDDLKTASDFEQYKKFAELLKIFALSVEKGREFVELTDVWSADGAKIIVELDPALPPIQNAELYFKKYRKGRQGHELLQRRLEIAKKELKTSLEMQEQFEIDFDSAIKKYEAEINSLLPKATEKKTITVRLPYREMTLSTGLTIFVGRDGADNDSTTFGYAKPYELWFHTSQCPGSHVVMKFPDKNFEPSKGEIAEAAAVAAYHSKARNAATVPVIYTQKKYVRKPRKAKSGLVTVEHEKLVLVKPKQPE